MEDQLHKNSNFMIKSGSSSGKISGGGQWQHFCNQTLLSLGITMSMFNGNIQCLYVTEITYF